jgi:hypothetical protein
MKNFLLTLLFCVVTASSVAQNSNPCFLRSELGYAFTGSGDITGSLIGMEAGKFFSKSFSTSLGVNKLSFKNDFSFLENASVTGIELTNYMIFLQGKNYSVGAGAGAFVRKWDWIYATGPETSLYTGGYYLEPNSYKTITEKTIGYTALLNIVRALSKQVSLGTKGVLQNDTEGNIVLSARGYIMVNF